MHYCYGNLPYRPINERYLLIQDKSRRKTWFESETDNHVCELKTKIIIEIYIHHAYRIKGLFLFQKGLFWCRKGCHYINKSRTFNLNWDEVTIIACFNSSVFFLKPIKKSRKIIKYLRGKVAYLTLKFHCTYAILPYRSLIYVFINLCLYI